MKKLYIMLSRTDTGVGKLIRLITGYQYNHVSLSLDGSFRSWVSFARHVQDTPLYAGFIREPVERYLAKGEQILVRIFEISLTEERYDALQKLFSRAGTMAENLHYNIYSLATGAFGLEVPVPGAYTCLGFANRILGTACRSIRALDNLLQKHLVYDGALNELTPDSGARDDIYFSRLGFFGGAARSLEAAARLLHSTVHPKPDPVSQYISQEGVTL